MAKVDRLGWAAGLSITCDGVRLGVRTNDPSLLPRIAERMPARAKSIAGPVVSDLFSVLVGGASKGPIRRFHILYADSFPAVRSLDLDEVLAVLEREVEGYVATLARRRTYLRAGVVGWKGRAIVVSGPEGSGRRTLTEALVRAGATLYSDRFAVLDARGRVHSCRKGAREAALPIGVVALTRYVPGARFRPRRLTAGRAVLRLLPEAGPAPVRPRETLEVLGRSIANAHVVHGSRGTAEAAARALLDLAAR